MIELKLPPNNNKTKKLGNYKILAKITDLVRDKHSTKIVFNECKSSNDDDKYFYAVMQPRHFRKLEIGKTYILLIAKGINHTCFFQEQVIDNYYIIYDIKPVIY